MQPGEEAPIRLILIDLQADQELHYPLLHLTKHSLRNQINFINAKNHQDLLIHQSQINSQRSSQHSNHSSSSAAQNHLADQSDLDPEIWWLIEFKKDNQESFKISTNDTKLIDQKNKNGDELERVVRSIKKEEGNINKTNYFLITIHYNRKCDAFRALGHVLGLTRLTKSRGSTPTGLNNNHISKELDASTLDLNTSTSTGPNHTSNSNEKLASKDENEGEQTKQISKTKMGHPFDKILHYLAPHHQRTPFISLGIMIDCSRNGVLRVNKVMELIRFIALMGLNLLQLYTEDTYEIKGEPFFGYFRGPYKQDELKEIDDYADSFGIEVVPCIQTLGHLGQMLQWPRYGAMRDTHEVLLVGSEEVYKFIEKMIVSITKPLRSKKIHIGMDEAHGVSEGRYRQLFGHKDSSQVFTDHLKRVNQICSKLDLKPMIWSDMLFCLAAKNNSLGGYYDSVNPATPELVQSIPPEIELVYWDYYHTTSTPYLNKINQHRDLNYKPPAMASGIWTWSRFWTALPFTIDTIRASMKAIKNPKSGVKHALTTIWGDEGNECDMYVFHLTSGSLKENNARWSALPGILFYSEQAYSTNSNSTNEEGEIDMELLKLKFDGICGGSFDDFVFASKLDDLESENQLIDDKARFTPNLSKWLIWEEPFFSILSPQYAGYDLETHYNKLSEYLERAINDSTTDVKKSDLPMNERLKLPYLLSKILALKCHLRDRLVLAYRQNDRVELDALVGQSHTSRLSRLRSLVDQIWKYHRSLWMSMYKPFGWEVLELRYGGLKARLETMQERLNDYMQGKLSEIEELEANTELVYPTSGAVMMLDYHRVSRPQYC